VDWSAGMRSSEPVQCLTFLAWRLIVPATLLLTACSMPPVASQTTSTAPAADCVGPQAGVSPQNAEAAGTLRRAVEMGPLYVTLVANRVVSCRIGTDSSAITLEYTFRDGSSLRVRRDPRIEYSNQEVRLASPLAEDAVAIMTRVERSAFSPSGCGIDWRKTEAQPAGDDPGATETIYRGDTCNCQARVRKDKAGRTVGLVFRSAC